MQQARDVGVGEGPFTATDADGDSEAEGLSDAEGDSDKLAELLGLTEADGDDPAACFTSTATIAHVSDGNVHFML